MPVIMGQYEIEALAKRLAKMRFNRAKWYIRNLDPKCRLDIFRVAVGNEWHTRFTLPTLNLRITLVEKHETQGEHKRGLKARFRYVEARVEPIPEALRPKPREEEFLLT
ncbi:MAG: hypothetical protein CUN49_02215 [Candidatus Thermofonsia Clade 1 bacterium]|jgi:hypothetical protein|uniref:Uncharacterized protein n=1 Tax=Candidatus Thermofonsia Clade 1 bacterium TaxID=2364210 RepID=A0A2M8PHR8_9CHLR|nr:MAG: hypothetical protein CUN49_02215 [Candidatus Thermofonsia Clade 1 bacterium]RMF51781.1 MAG: hypothetical protein D6749_06890 [Chloroflexota bacterium]